MKQHIRFFAIGLLTSALLAFGFYLVIDETEVQLENAPLDELIGQVESEGYRVITEDEFIDYSFYKEEKLQQEANGDKKKDNKKDKKKDDEKDDTDKKKSDKESDKEKDDEKDEVKKVTITVSQGDVSQDIAKKLVDNDIIEDAFEFVQYLEDNNYSPYIQLGSFEITSDMDFKDIAETITTYPGN